MKKIILFLLFTTLMLTACGSLHSKVSPTIAETQSALEESAEQDEMLKVFDAIKDVHPGTAGSSLKVAAVAYDFLNACRVKLPFDLMAGEWVKKQDKTEFSDINESFVFVYESLDQFKDSKMIKGLLSDAGIDLPDGVSFDGIIDEAKKVLQVVIDATNVASIEFEKINATTVDKVTNYLSINFGNYGGESIEWLVIDKNDDTALLLSKKILDCRNYNDEKKEVSWEDSDMRKWLNLDFIDTAFTNEEQKIFGNMNAYGFGLIKGDKVSLLNAAMCERYFAANADSKQNKALAAKGTDYAKTKGLECDNNKGTDFYECGSYFLSDNGDALDKAAWVGQYGRIYLDGQSVKLETGDGVRPIICIKTEAFTNGVIDSINANIFNIDASEKNDESEADIAIAESELSVEKVEEEIVTNVEKNYVYSNVSKDAFQSASVPCSEKNVVDLGAWKYGKTPVEWVYVAPNTQLLSNSSPNKSSKFGYKTKASSGPKGCYMVVFTNCDEVKGSDYDGRLYCFEDYTKIPLDELKFNNKFEELQYEEYNVLELLKKRYEMTDISKGVYMAGDVYVNVIYVDELDDIIASGK